MMFRTQYQRKRVTSNVGSPYVTEYRPVFDENGVLSLEKSGQRCLYDEIQADKESCDINIIVKRYMAGDTSVLERRQGFFADVTQFPSNYSEMLNIVINGEREFDSLPVDIKSKFDNDFAKFVASIGQPEWYEKLGYVSQKEDIKVDEVKEVNTDNE